MGHWVMIIEGHGIHDNGREDDADVMLHRFAADLALHHDITAVTFTVGSTRQLVNTNSDGQPEPPAGRPLGPDGHTWHQR